MLEISPLLNSDGYKQSHYKCYSPHTATVYSTWTPRKSRMDGINEVVVFGVQYFIKDFLIESFNKNFFSRPKEEVLSEFKRVMKQYNKDDDITRWEVLHNLGFLPLRIKCLEEGTLCPIRVPMFTIENTLPQFYWLTNFIETIMSTEVWKPMTSATIALEYRKILDKWAEKTCDDNSHVDFQGHDFSMRGMAGLDSACSSGAGHLLSFKGTDTIPAVLWLEKYYNANCEKEVVGCSIPATEHSVAETNIIELEEIINNERKKFTNFAGLMNSRKQAELEYFKRLLNVYSSGIFSYVADTYNLWAVLTDILPVLKNKIMSRDGKVVIRPDSGDPCDIICGLNTNDKYIRNKKGKLCYNTIVDNGLAQDEHPEVDLPYIEQQSKGVIELLWDVFGGTINSKGYKVLDPHIGCLYGDAITLERAEEICRRLESKGFASSNIVFGIGSYTYNMNTRDTFGFALKTTYGEIFDTNLQQYKKLMLYKKPITDSGEKFSAKGRVVVVEDKEGKLNLIDNLDWKTEQQYCNDGINKLETVFEDGVLIKEYTLKQIRNKIGVMSC